MITLGIIGVVAAMTLPALVAKYQEVVMVNKLKRTYSSLVNSMDMRRAELGASDYKAVFDTDMTTAEQLDGVVKNLHVIARCHDGDKKGCGGSYSIKPKSRSNDGFGNVRDSQLSTSGERAILNDGTLVTMSKRNYTGDCIVEYVTHDVDANGNYTNLDSNGKPVPKPYNAQHCAEVFFDIDGPKGQNQFGYDSYSFVIRPRLVDQHLGYGGVYDTMRTGKLTYANYGSGKF